MIFKAKHVGWKEVKSELEAMCVFSFSLSIITWFPTFCLKSARRKNMCVCVFLDLLFHADTQFTRTLKRVGYLVGSGKNVW